MINKLKKIPEFLSNEIKNFLSFLDIDKWLLIVLYPRQYFSVLLRVAKNIQPKKNIVYFCIQVILFRMKIFFSGKKNKRILYVNRKFFLDSQKSNRPVIIVAWHSLALSLNQLEVATANSNSVIVVSHSNISGTLSIANNEKASLIKIIHAINNNKNIMIAFDGLIGKASIEAIFFGCRVYFGQGYPFLVKQFKPIVIPCSPFITSDMRLAIKWHQPLFTEKEMKTMAMEEIIQKTIELFQNEQKTLYPYQIFFLRYFNCYIHRRVKNAF